MMIKSIYQVNEGEDDDKTKRERETSFDRIESEINNQQINRKNVNITNILHP